MPISSELLALLICPATKSSLRLATPALIKQLNRAIASGRLKNRGGQVVDTPLEEGLMSADNQWLYAVRNDVPVMLIAEALPLSGFLTAED